jgi:hypothetical protein
MWARTAGWLSPPVIAAYAQVSTSIRPNAAPNTAKLCGAAPAGTSWRARWKVRSRFGDSRKPNTMVGSTSASCIGVHSPLVWMPWKPSHGSSANVSALSGKASAASIHSTPRGSAASATARANTPPDASDAPSPGVVRSASASGTPHSQPAKKT